MGIKTRSQIVTEGLLMAGDSKLTTRAKAWLNGWLRSQYAGFMWPFLLQQETGIALAEGEATFTIGAGSGGVTPAIRRIVDPIWIYTSDKKTRSRIRIHSMLETDESSELDVNDEAEHTGLPSQARCHADATTWGKWQVRFDRWADKDYLIKLSYYEQPEDIDETSGGDSTVPRYPNDRTMIKAVEVEALRYKKAENFQNELEVLASMVVDDRLKFGEVPGQNDYILLDPSVFR